ncbi:LacI family transcriptional regulator [Rhodobacter capsulatus]|uniref:LacI family transcriptional regulator n=1 Tax=Rhodobacter capsulatus TaxID=1061 RepID=A0A4U1JU67_RHOCA|nr:substrate-binding domain-containing protein [Rhodobacter capsulatus]TKD22762.1 LacI family transcriptional regulator [Rhodobacter capsulatus]
MTRQPIAPGSRPPSAAEVARLAGVSRSAVSRTFTDGASVSRETRDRVLAAAEALNYHVNHLARGISKPESRPVCLIGATLAAPFHAALFDRLTQALQAAGRMVMVVNTGSDPADGRGAEQALEQALGYRAAATVVLSGTPPADLVRRCVAAGQRMILLNRAETLPGVCHLQTEDAPAMRDCVAMLQRAGVRRAALVTSASGTAGLVRRTGHFLAEAAAAGLSVRLWQEGPTSYETGQRAGRELLGGADRPEGIFCANDLLAFGLLDVARVEFRLQIPRDLNVIGFDDVPQAGWGAYDLTTFAQPFEALAERIVAIIASEEPPPARPETLPPKLRWRSSVRPGTGGT